LRALLAGAAGFIGSHLSDRLLQEGWEVIGVDNLSTGRRRNLISSSSSPHFTFVEADVVHPLKIRERLDWVLHLASPASPPKYMERPIETLRANSQGTYNLLELALLKGAQFLFASTSEIYGDPLVHPQTETYWGNVNPIGPRSVYDEAKRYAESMVICYLRSRGLQIRLPRIFNTYGPRMDPHDGRVVSNMVCQALQGRPISIYGSGLQTRSFQYISDLVEGIRRLMDTPYHGPVNLGNPVELTVLQAAELVMEISGTAGPIEYAPLPIDDPKRRCPDISLAKSLLHWEPAVDVRTGLRYTIDYFRAELEQLSDPNDWQVIHRLAGWNSAGADPAVSPEASVRVHSEPAIARRKAL
jgi:nucleoside-diphosphate-sugar epimerase